jgi:hypothetical protein
VQRLLDCATKASSAKSVHAGCELTGRSAVARSPIQETMRRRIHGFAARRSGTTLAAVCLAVLNPLVLPSKGSAVTPESTPCSDADFRQFDFWVGDWDVFDQDRPGKREARAKVERILDRCVIHEIYNAADGHKGESFTIYDASRHTWHQTWATDHGQLLTIEGRRFGNSMVLEGSDRAPDARTRQVRGTWRPEANGVREIAMRSLDGGAHWVPWFDIVFRAHRP